jgi:tripartite-type tricarboxylate transporter receptor subunit TctC
VKSAGFAEFVETIEIRSAVPQQKEIVLKLAAVATEITVQAQVPLIDPLQPGQVMQAGREQLEQTPGTTLGRSTVDVITTMLDPTLPLAPVVMAQVTGDKTVKYDVSKMNWIGRTVDSNQVLYVSNTAKAQTFAELKTNRVVIGSSGPASASAVIPYVMNVVFGTQMHVVLGYSGSATFNLAVQRGETDGALTTLGTVRNNYAAQLKEGKIRILFQVSLARHPDLPDVPTALEMAAPGDDRSLIELMTSTSEMGQAFVAPPDVPGPIVAALRRAFDATMQDPDYIALSEKTGNSLNPLDGAALAAIVATAMATPQKVIDRYQAAVANIR